LVKVARRDHGRGGEVRVAEGGQVGGVLGVEGLAQLEAQVGEVGGEASRWFGECRSGDPTSRPAGFPRGGPRGTAVILASSDWKELEGEYMLAIPWGSMWGGALKGLHKEKLFI